MQRVEDRKVFVGGLGRNTTNQSLRTYFGQFGAVEEVALPKNPEDGNGRGFGFTTFSEVSAANKALEAEEHVIDGKQVDVKVCFINPRRGPDGNYRRDATGDARNINGNGGPNRYGPQGHTDPKKVFVGGLPLEATKENLQEALSQYGEVQHAVVMMDLSTNRSKGFGFVTFDEKEICDSLVKQQFIQVLGKQVEVKPAIVSAKPFESNGNQNNGQYNNNVRDGQRNFDGPRRRPLGPQGRGGYYQASGDSSYNNNRNYGPRAELGPSYAGNGNRRGQNLQYQQQNSQWSPYGLNPIVSSEYPQEMYATAGYPSAYAYELQGPYAGYTTYAAFTPQALEQGFKAMNLGESQQESMAAPMQGMMTGNMAMPGYLPLPNQSLNSSGPSSPPQMNMHAANLNTRMPMHPSCGYTSMQPYFSPAVGVPNRPQGPGFAGNQMPEPTNIIQSPLALGPNAIGSGDGNSTTSMKDNLYRR